MAAFGPTGQLLPLDEVMAEAGVQRSDFIEALLTIFTYEGKTYGLPKDWGTLGLVYLPEVFAEAGIDEPTADWTWDDLKAAAEAIVANTDYAGFCQNADWARFAPFAFGAGGSYTNDAFTEGVMNSAEVVSAADFIVGMYEDGSLVTSADVGAGWCGEAIGKELVGMTYEGGWMVNYMRQDYPDVNWKATPPAQVVGWPGRRRDLHQRHRGQRCHRVSEGGSGLLDLRHGSREPGGDREDGLRLLHTPGSG